MKFCFMLMAVLIFTTVKFDEQKPHMNFFGVCMTNQSEQFTTTERVKCACTCTFVSKF
jgi:hypothetical protein